MEDILSIFLYSNVFTIMMFVLTWIAEIIFDNCLNC